MNRLLLVSLLLCVPVGAQIRLGGAITAGSQPVAGVYYPSDYGGSIQGAIDAIPACTHPACAGDSGGVQLEAKPGGYTITKPLLLNKNGMRLEGVSYTLSTALITDQTWYGPLIMVVPADYPAPPTQTSLATGDGSAFTLNGTSNYWINLREIPTTDLNGLGAFTVRFFYKPTHDSTGEFNGQALVSSSGAISHSSAVDKAFYVFQYINNRMRAQIKIGSTTHDLQTADNALTINTTAHIALTYDGTTVRLFVNGVVAASEAATGTVTQRPWEDVMVGPQSNLYPAQNWGDAMAQGAVDGIEFSDNARYTAGFTPPTAKPTRDSHTLVLLKFDEFYGPFIVGQSGTATKAYLQYHQNGVIGLGSEVNNVQVRNVSIYSNDSGGLWATSAPYATYDHVYISGARYGFYLFDNCFGTAIRNSQVVSSAPANLGSSGSGIMAVSQAGIFRIDHVNLNGGALMYVQTAGSAEISDLQLSPNSYTQYGVILGGSTVNASAYHFSGFGVFDEAPDPPSGPRPAKAAILLDGISSALFSGGSIEFHPGSGVSSPIAQVDGGARLQFNNTQFSNSTSSPDVTFISNPTSPVVLDNINRVFHVAAISSDMAQVVVRP